MFVLFGRYFRSPDEIASGADQKSEKYGSATGSATPPQPRKKFDCGEDVYQLYATYSG